MKCLLFLSLIFAAALPASDPGSLSSTAKAEKPGSYEQEGTVFAVGETLRIVASKQGAEREALRDAAARAAELLERRGLGTKADLARGVENSALKEVGIRSKKLGKVKIESAYQERGDLPDGKEAWSARVKISIELKQGATP